MPLLKRRGLPVFALLRNDDPLGHTDGPGGAVGFVVGDAVTVTVADTVIVGVFDALSDALRDAL